MAEALGESLRSALLADTGHRRGARLSLTMWQGPPTRRIAEGATRRAAYPVLVRSGGARSNAAAHEHQEYRRPLIGEYGFTTRGAAGKEDCCPRAYVALDWFEQTQMPTARSLVATSRARWAPGRESGAPRRPTARRSAGDALRKQQHRKEHCRPDECHSHGWPLRPRIDAARPCRRRPEHLAHEQPRDQQSHRYAPGPRPSCAGDRWHEQQYVNRQQATEGRWGIQTPPR